MRVLLVVHRYLGVAVGLLMLLWCLSGFVMMYQGYPQLTPGERTAGLEPLDLSGCCNRALSSLPRAGRLLSFKVEMLAGRPVLRLSPSDAPPRTLDLSTGEPIASVTAAQAVAVARAYGAGHRIAGAPRNLGLIDKDQWTVEGASRRGPVYHLAFDDPAGTEIYVAANTGEVVQDTTRSERVWSWFGAIPHWLYPVILRQNGRLWDAVVVWASLIGCFLTATGLYVGVARFRRYRNGRWSPYRGWQFWHHIAGLIFGVLALTWVASGLLTMNPWGFLDSPVGPAERLTLSGGVNPSQIRDFLPRAARLNLRDVVEIEAAPLGGRLFVDAVGRGGRSEQLDDSGRLSPLQAAEVAQALQGMGGPRVARLERLTREDAYYYSGYQHPAALPVYRARLADDQATTFYIDASDGQMVQALDRTSRESRWLRTGLHDFDLAWMRGRPIWDIIVLSLLAGVTAVCGTGAWLSLKRVWLDVTRFPWPRKSIRPRTGA